MFLPSMLTTPLPRKIGVAKGCPAMVSTMRNHSAMEVAPMKPVITPSRRKLCGRSAIDSSNGYVRLYCGKIPNRGIYSKRNSRHHNSTHLAPWHLSRHVVRSSLHSTEVIFQTPIAADVLS